MENQNNVGKKEKKQPKYYIKVNKNTQPSIVKGNVKIGKGIFSFSLLPGDEPITLKDGTLLTSIKGTCGGVCKDCIKDCYAMRDAKLHNNVTISAWGKNTIMMRRDMDGLMKKINKFIKAHDIKIFRWQVAGEIESYEYLVKMNEVAKQNPDVKFGVYTKRFDFVKKYLDEHESFEPNLCVNISEWNHNTDGYDFEKLNKFVWDDGSDPEISALPHCPAVSKPTTPGGKGKETGVTCDKCGKCYRTTGTKTAVYNH